MSCRNSRVIVYYYSDLPTFFGSKNPASVRVFGTVENDESVINAHFIESSLKVGTKKYLDILKNSLLPWMEQKFGLDNVMFIQDSAPRHVSKTTQGVFSEEVLFLLQTSDPKISNISINLDCFLMGVRQAKTNASPYKSIHSLEICNVRATRKTKMVEVAAAAKLFHSCMEAVIAQKGNYIE